MILAARARRTCHTSLALQASPVTPLFASLTAIAQMPENITTLSPVFATLTPRVTPNSFICHSYKKHPGGWGIHLRQRKYLLPSFAAGLSLLCESSVDSAPLRYLFPFLSAPRSDHAHQHPQPLSTQSFTSRFSGYPGGWGSHYLQLPHSPSSAIIVGLTKAANSASARQRGYPRSHDAA